jgi:hypothetical protein
MKNILLTIAFLACFIYNAGAQTDPTNPQVICLQSVEPYEVDAPNGTPGSTYTWSVTSPGFTGSIISGQGTNEIMIDWGSTPIGTYVLQVIETNLGCPGLPVTLNIEIVPPPTPVVLPQAICPGGTATLTATPTGMNYLWSTGATTESISVSPASDTNYSVTVTDANGCSGTASGAVTINPGLIPTVTPDAICEGGTATLTATPTGMNYLWSTGATTESISASPAATTNYSVTVTDANGCSGTASNTVTVNTPPTPTVTPDAICEGGTATLTATPTGMSYLWSTGATTESISASPAATTNYSVTVTDANGCSGTASNTVTVNTPPTPAVLPQAICPGGTATLTATPTGMNYLWSTGATTESISVSPASDTNYSVTVTDANGCSGTASGAVTLLQQILPDFTQLGPYCEGETPGALPATSNNGITGTWSPAVINTSNSGTTTYTFTPDPNQCAIPTSMDIVINALPVVTAPDITECDGVPIVLNGNPAGGVYSIPNPYTGPSTTYTYTYTDANGCTATATGTITINPLPNTSPIFHD